MVKTFGDWIIGEIELRSWSGRELARRSGLSSTTVTQVINGQVKPGLTFCNGLAHAFNVPVENILRRAGLIPPAPKETATTAELLFLAEQLDEDDLERLVNIARGWAGEREVTPRGTQQPQSSPA